MVTLQLEVPAEIAVLLGGRRQATEAAREHIILGLYQESRISGGKAAELLGLTRGGFISMLARKGLDYFRCTNFHMSEALYREVLASANEVPQ